MDESDPLGRPACAYRLAWRWNHRRVEPSGQTWLTYRGTWDHQTHARPRGHPRPARARPGAGRQPPGADTDPHQPAGEDVDLERPPPGRPGRPVRLRPAVPRRRADEPPSAPRMDEPRTIGRHHHLPGRRRPSGRLGRPTSGARHPELPGRASTHSRQPRPEPRCAARGGLHDAVLAGGVRHRPAAGSEPLPSSRPPGTSTWRSKGPATARSASSGSWTRRGGGTPRSAELRSGEASPYLGGPSAGTTAQVLGPDRRRRTLEVEALGNFVWVEAVESLRNWAVVRPRSPRTARPESTSSPPSRR